ncbi:uncharacterized LOC118063714 [Chelonus insularis]|uniref:uncharacterized LOC118063714 n=1 Tax=Chelonus insularis TaxID=460826 RepID=UPI001589FDC5|nr:uncharacterized LOC118063714 [Chelonus insularis]KAG8148365.1 vlf-1b-2 protein [Chelonus insularis]
MTVVEGFDSEYRPFNYRDELSKTYQVKPVKVPSYRDMTIETQTTHFAKLRQLNIDPLSLTDKTVSEALHLLKKSGRPDKELSNAYINSIYSTMKRINPALSTSASKLGFPRKNRKTVIDDRLDLHHGIKQMLTTIIKYVANFTTVEPRKIESRRVIDTIIASILTLLTNLRSTELFKLQLKHLEMISQDTPITINTKCQSHVITVMKIKPLYDLLYPKLKNIILSRELKFNLDYLEDPKSITRDESNIILLSCKNDTINKTFYELYIRINQKRPNVTLGLKTIRSFNLTLMMDPDDFLEHQEVWKKFKEQNEKKKDDLEHLYDENVSE